VRLLRLGRPGGTRRKQAPARVRAVPSRSVRALSARCKANDRDATGPPRVVTRIALRPADGARFEWLPFVAFLRARALPGVESVDGVTYRRSIEVDGVAGTIEIQPTIEALHAMFDDRLPRGRIGPRLRRWFDLDADLATIEAHLARDPLLGPLVVARPGLRVPGAWDSFELAIRAIIGQQVSVAGARTIAGRLVARAGDRLERPVGDVVAVFPRPEQVALADLSSIGMPGARARSIVGFAAAVAEDPSLLEPSGDLDAIAGRLKALPGIGEWTAQYIALRGLRQPDAFPASDLGILRALAGPDGRRPTPAQALARAEPWRPYRAYAAQHLWSADAG
jgi:AraC family transcriptional regulator, regulatory protein of adaptative response / DNA-3-methyladenine glycosylase II